MRGVLSFRLESATVIAPQCMLGDVHRFMNTVTVRASALFLPSKGATSLR